jgi:hypothetical protein
VNHTCHRKDDLKEDIEEGKCGPGPEWEKKPWKKRMIYNPKLILDLILAGSISIEIVEMYALEVIQEQARKLL